MISFYFGLPGSGKTTLLAADAFAESKRISRGKSKYKAIYSNVELFIPHTFVIDFDMLGRYLFENCLILIDEASVFCDNRDWKNFGKEKIAFFMLHRHYDVDVKFYSQSYNGYDSKLRSITQNVYYITRGLILPITKCMRIPYGILIPDRKDNAGAKFGDIVEGYCKPPFFVRLFARRVWRPKYYKYFDSKTRPLRLMKLPPQLSPR